MMMPTDLEARWSALIPDMERPVFQLYDAEHPLRFYVGRENSGERLLLLVTGERPPALRDLRAIRLRTYRREDGTWSLLLALGSDELSPVFSLLCNDLIESSRLAKTDAAALGLVLRRLANWRRLLERGGHDLLGENEIRGLCGELLCLNNLVTRLGKLEAVKAWVGPKGADQDFQAPDDAWEVKTIRPDAQKILIASERQLFSSSRAIELVVIELGEKNERTVDSFTLNELVASMRSALADDLEASDLFEERLSAAGYILRAEYDSPNLAVASIRKFSVRDGFPCITPTMLPAGVSQAGYQILLTACEPFTTD
jgi:hypothetical protein